MFGASLSQNKPAGSLFGSTLNPPAQQSGGGLFGNLGTTNQQNQQQGSSLFGNTQQNQQQQTGGLFGQSTQAQPQQQAGGLFGNLGQSTQQNQQSGGLFGQGTQQNQQPGGLFGQSTQQAQQQGGGLFGGGLGQNNQQNQGSSLFGGLGQNTQQQPQQSNQQSSGSGLFGGSAFGQSIQASNQQGQPLWQQRDNGVPREKSVPEQMVTVLEKWDIGNANCVFKHYFYNKIEPQDAPYYRPGPNEDPKAWEEALSKKPGPGYVPVLCTGFAQMGERIKIQQRSLATFNARLHEINIALSNMMQQHETNTSIRAMDARRKHIDLKRRCLVLATKVQVLRNRGYALGGDEEDLRTKLLMLEKNVNDPGLGARGEEIWARMLTVQERARLLKSEIEKAGRSSPDILDEEMSRRAKKILEDYNTQLVHLKTELDSIAKEYIEWEKEQGPMIPKVKPVSKNDTQGRSLQFR